jgi:hypothetical protein
VGCALSSEDLVGLVITPPVVHSLSLAPHRNELTDSHTSCSWMMPLRRGVSKWTRVGGREGFSERHELGRGRELGREKVLGSDGRLCVVRVTWRSTEAEERGK